MILNFKATFRVLVVSINTAMYLELLSSSGPERIPFVYAPGRTVIGAPLVGASYKRASSSIRKTYSVFINDQEYHFLIFIQSNEIWSSSQYLSQNESNRHPPPFRSRILRPR